VTTGHSPVTVSYRVSMATELPARLTAAGWKFVAEEVAVRTARRDDTTTTVVLSGDDAVLVDPAWEPDELDAIADSLRTAHVVAGFATHAHVDHLLWHPDLGAVPRWSSPVTAALARLRRTELAEELGDVPAAQAELHGKVEGLPSGLVPWAGQPIQLIVHDGHENGHTALWLPRSRVLVAGDMLSDVELPWPENRLLDAYAVALATLRPYAQAARWVIPGHGTPTEDGAARWRADARYLDQVMAGLDPDDPRRANPGMEQVHQDSLVLARTSFSGSDT
jgi:glyoxylase-like metal-dependent hydrolase (beta-lactamase superfamily II)